MAVYTKSFFPIPTLNYVEDPDLVNARIIKVSRNGKTLWWDGVTPTGSENKYVHDFNTGRVTVSADNPFIVSQVFVPPHVMFVFEKFKVIYKK